MNYQLTCQCGKKLVVSRSQAGQEIDCSCGVKNSIPTLRGLALLPLVDDPALQSGSATRAQEAESTWKGWRGVLISLLAAVGIGTFALGAWFLYERQMVDTSYTEQVERKAGREMIDQMEIEDLTTMFDEFRTHGLGMKSPPPFLIIQTYAQQRVRYALICGAIALACAAAAAAVAYAKPRKP